MSPISVALPPPPVEVSAAAQSPPQFATNTRPNQNMLDGARWSIYPAHARGMLPSATLNVPLEFGGVGAGGAFDRYEVRGGRNCTIAARTSGGANLGDGRLVTFPGAMPSFSAAGMAPGATLLPDGVVYVMDLTCALATAAAPLWQSDATPYLFLPQASTVNIRCSPGMDALGEATVDVGGFGLFLNNVAAAPLWQYLSWDATYGTLERIDLPVADPTDFNTFRVIIISAAAGRPASLEVRVNDEPRVLREFGSPELLTPGQASALLAAPGGNYALGTFVGGPTNPGYFHAMSLRLGRFTPDGREVQGV